MKFFFVLFVGVVLGVAGTLTFQNPRDVGKAARETISAAETKVEDVRRDSCVREFLRETQCFQNKPAKECDRLIVKECGAL